MKEFKIPTTYSAMCILGNNSINDGDDFREDYYVYRNNKPVRKWFTTISNYRVWPPNLNNPKELENKYVAIRSKVLSQWEKVRELANYIYSKGGSAHAKPTHRYTISSDGKNYWLYNFDRKDGGRLSWHFNWCKEPTEKINQDLGQRFYELNARADIMANRLNVAKIFLDESIKRLIKNNLPKDFKFDSNFRVDLNNRTYFYHFTTEKYEYTPSLKILSWPESNTIKLEVEKL